MMVKPGFWLCLILAVVFFTPGAATAQNGAPAIGTLIPPVPLDKAQFVFFRENLPGNCRIRLAQGPALARLEDSRFFVYEAAPGLQHFELESKDRGIQVHAEAGERKFIRCHGRKELFINSLNLREESETASSFLSRRLELGKAKYLRDTPGVLNRTELAAAFNRGSRSQTAVAAPGPPVQVPAPTASQPRSNDIELAIMEATGPRVALIIGNESYTSAMGSLANPVNDVVLIGATLRRVGFDVEILTNASQREMKEAVQRLGDRLLAAGENATGLFFYAGHGVQSKGVNYLIPVGSSIDAESDLELEAVSANAILAQMEEAYVSTRIVILDACRNMPLRRRTRDGTRGLARMETPNGSFVAYSTAPGSTAADGGGIHSPFAEALSAQMLVPDRPIEVTFREVRRQVVEMTNGDQVPWDASSLLETFSFARGGSQ